MSVYRLYLESGPRMKTTMVHVLDLLGCIANGPTTEAALEATPGEIREYLRFLQHHGEDVDPDAPFTTTIAAHVMEGPWLGYGDPAPGFEPDFAPLSRDELAAYVPRLRQLGEELAAIAHRVPPAELAGTPEKGRPIQETLRHVAAAEPEYLRVGGLGKPEGAKEAVKAIESAADGPDELAEHLERLWDILAARFESATDEERTQTIQRGQSRYTARRGLRRALEHPWEHLREIERRIESTAGVAKLA